MWSPVPFDDTKIIEEDEQELGKEIENAAEHVSLSMTLVF